MHNIILKVIETPLNK